MKRKLAKIALKVVRVLSILIIYPIYRLARLLLNLTDSLEYSLADYSDGHPWEFNHD